MSKTATQVRKDQRILLASANGVISAYTKLRKLCQDHGLEYEHLRRITKSFDQTGGLDIEGINIKRIRVQ